MITSPKIIVEAIHLLLDLRQFLSTAMEVNVFAFLAFAIDSDFDFHATFFTAKLIPSLWRR